MIKTIESTDGTQSGYTKLDEEVLKDTIWEAEIHLKGWKKTKAFMDRVFGKKDVNKEIYENKSS